MKLTLFVLSAKINNHNEKNLDTPAKPSEIYDYDGVY